LKRKIDLIDKEQGKIDRSILETITIFAESLNSESFKKTYKENFVLIEELHQEYENKEISFRKFINNLLRIVENDRPI